MRTATKKTIERETKTAISVSTAEAKSVPIATAPRVVKRGTCSTLNQKGELTYEVGVDSRGESTAEESAKDPLRYLMIPLSSSLTQVMTKRDREATESRYGIAAILTELAHSQFLASQANRLICCRG